jgi:choline dehydrogenase-like flavoprotein
MNTLTRYSISAYTNCIRFLKPIYLLSFIPTVGENLHDQTNNAFTWESSNPLPLTGLATFSTLPSVNHLYGDDLSSLASLVNASLPTYAKAISRASNVAVQERNILEALSLQYDLIFASHVPYAEIVFAPTGNSFAVEYWPLLPFSRGSVHIASANASQPPAIKPNYFKFEQDAAAQTDMARYIRKAQGTAPLSEIVRDEVTPGLDVLPGNSSKSTWNEWVLANCKFLLPWCPAAAYIAKVSIKLLTHL